MLKKLVHFRPLYVFHVSIDRKSWIIKILPLKDQEPYFTVLCLNSMDVCEI